MSLDPDERLEALRREILAERPAAPDAVRPAPPAPPPSPGPAAPPPDRVPRPATTPAPASGSPLGLLARLVPDLDLDVRGLLPDRSVSSWLGIGLLVVGGYLVLSWIVPGISIIGSLVLLIAGIVVLYQHLARGGAPWMLYVGAALTGMGAARIVGALLPGSWDGMTAIGVGVAFLVIGYLRHSQAGGYGWQGIVGGAAIALGVVQMVLGWLPGSPGLFDLLSPAVLLVAGVVLVIGTRRFGTGRPPTGRT